MNLFLIVLMAAALSGFEDFRRIDRTRRFTGQMLTAELLQVSQMDAGLILRTTQQHPDDPKILWGAAELLVDWSQRRTLYELALERSGTNAGMAVRFACAAAQQHDYDIALAWLHNCQKLDADNTVPWLAELWLLRPTVLSNSPPIWTTNFRDYSIEASGGRIRTLEAAGYSPYAARRLGFSPDSPAISMARDLCKPPAAEQTATLLKDTAQSLQRRPPFLLWEFVGQTIERALMTRRPDVDTSVEVHYRSVEMDKRREELKHLLTDIERNTIDYANEAEMVRYFDDVLDIGEEAAMKKLAETVRRQTAPK
jgi:hypothetical protein